MFCCSDSTAFCFTIHLFRRNVWSNGHSYNFLCQFFAKSLGILDTEGKNNNNNNNNNTKIYNAYIVTH